MQQEGYAGMDGCLRLQVAASLASCTGGVEGRSLFVPRRRGTFTGYEAMTSQTTREYYFNHTEASSDPYKNVRIDMKSSSAFGRTFVLTLASYCIMLSCPLDSFILSDIKSSHVTVQQFRLGSLL